MRKTIIFMLSLALVACTAKQPKMEDECLYSPSKTQFAFWSNSAEQMEVLLYEQSDDVQCTKVVLLKKDANDFWKATVKGDLAGKFYTVRSFQDGEWGQESPGIFAKTVSVNGQRAAILDLKNTDPEGWDSDVRPAMPDMTDIVVYETHMRDYTMANPAIEHKGKFLGMAEDPSISHLKDLGITHLQILPMFDFGSVDERLTVEDDSSIVNRQSSNRQYNWGYDPVNYNVPDGGYSTDPYDPACRIREAKQMIQALHKAGIRVVMDVVYNHTYDANGCALGRVVPKYFYRLNEDGSFANGSGCGNETASDHEMMRRFMVESVCYWAREYHIDGFRFDLMGIHDQETMNAIREALDKIDPTIITYGEGWAAMAPAYPYEELAMKQWTYKMPRVGAFSDDIRNALIGSPFDHDPGFASGNAACKANVMNGLVGCIGFDDPNGQLGPEPLRWSGEPMQHVSYITCHDNYCLRDRIEVSTPDQSEAAHIRMNKLAQTAVLVSQGMSFLYGGEELYRTKQGIDNSYQSPDSINIIPWENKVNRQDLFTYYQQMIAIRRAHKGFRLGTAEAVKEHVEFLPVENDHLIVYRIKDLEGLDSAKTLIVLLNGGEEEVKAEIPEGAYTILAFDGEAKADGSLGDFAGTQSAVAPFSATILIE